MNANASNANSEPNRPDQFTMLDLMSIQDVAERMGVSVKTIRRMRSGDDPEFPVRGFVLTGSGDRMLRFRVAEFAAWVAQCCPQKSQFDWVDPPSQVFSEAMVGDGVNRSNGKPKPRPGVVTPNPRDPMSNGKGRPFGLTEAARRNRAAQGGTEAKTVAGIRSGGG